MSVQLTGDDARALRDLLAGLQEFGTERNRRTLLLDLLSDAPQREAMVNRFDLEGGRTTVAGDVVQFVAGYGRAVYDREALGLFLNRLKPYVGGDGEAVIDGLFGAYAMDGQAAPAPVVKQWRGEDDPQSRLERVVGENALRHVNMLERALHASQGVMKITYVQQRGDKDDGKTFFGSGFLVAPDLVMTNHHVLANAAEAVGARFTFNSQLDAAGVERAVWAASMRPGGTYLGDPDLDYVVVQLAEAATDYPALAFSRQPIRKADRVAIIQHPEGGLKQIALQHNHVEHADPKLVQYTTTTLPGSSGSPVFNDLFEVVAVHHGWVEIPGAAHQFWHNEGTTARAILDDLRARAPEVHGRLRVVGGSGGAEGPGSLRPCEAWKRTSWTTWWTCSRRP